MKHRNLRLLTGVLAVAVAAVAAMGAAQDVEIVDPHEDPPICTSCHARTPTQEEADQGIYHLLGASIDATCHICHPYDCCRINSLKGHNHPSNVDEWDRDKFREPETLPLYDGLITCTTCHFNHRQEVPRYRMVRIVEVSFDKIDWTGLCVDCHKDYA